jgi:hypothetical protein
MDPSVLQQPVSLVEPRGEENDILESSANRSFDGAHGRGTRASPGSYASSRCGELVAADRAVRTTRSGRSFDRPIYTKALPLGRI